MNKVFADAASALSDVSDGAVILSGGFGLSGNPENCIRELARRGVNELHVEAGFRLNGSLVRAGCIDELLVYLAPSLIGDAAGMFDLPALPELEARERLVFHAVDRVGDDLRVLARWNRGLS